MAAGATDAVAEVEKSCRFCLACDHSLERPLIAPCGCKGSMKYVHRQCLDEWRVQCFNPKALVQCTICSTPFQIRHVSNRQAHHSWKIWLALDIMSFIVLRLLTFFAAACIMGFVPLGGEVLHPNPVVSHLLGGTTYTLALVGGSGLLYTMWHTPWEGSRMLRLLCPKRTGKSDSPSKALLYVLVIAGLCVVLWFLLRGLYRLVCEARHEIVGAVRGANAQARKKVVQDHIVLDLDEARCQA